MALFWLTVCCVCSLDAVDGGQPLGSEAEGMAALCHYYQQLEGQF